MIEKIKTNKKIILIILSIVSIAMFIPSLFGIFMNQINDYSIIMLIYYICLIGASGSILFIAYTKNDIDLKLGIIPVSLVLGGLILTNVYNIINNNNFLYVYYIALYAITLIIYIMYAINANKLKCVLYVLLLILIAFQILSVFGGSTVGFGLLILFVIFIVNLYLNKNQENKNEGEEE